MDPLINGKNETKRVVSIEVTDGQAELFIEDTDGNVRSEFITNKHWILSNYSQGKGWIKLAGDLHYKYGAQFDTRESFNKTLSFLRKKNADTYQVYDDKESCMINKGVTYFKGMTPKDPSTLSFDIESTGLYHNKDSKVLLISNTLRRGNTTIKKLFAYDEYENQADLINAWCDWVREVNPALIIGHNIYTYDLPYLNYIAEREGTELKLGRDGSAMKIFSKPSKFRVDGSRDQEYFKCRIHGREVIDTLFLLIRWDIGKSLSSNALKAAVRELGLEKEGRVFYDSGNIRHNYTIPEEWEKIKAYCVDDADDSLNLYDKICPAYFYMTQCIPKSYQAIVESASGSQLNAMMVRSYLQDGHSIPKASMTHKFQGAISAGIPGIYKNAKKWDVVSEYPSIIRTYEVYDSDKDPKAHLLKMTEYFFKERISYKKMYKETKNEQYDAIQNCFKVLLNSLYGFLGAEGLNFNFPEGAAFITEKGRETVLTAIKWATSKEFHEIVSDV